MGASLLAGTNEGSCRKYALAYNPPCLPSTEGTCSGYYCYEPSLPPIDKCKIKKRTSYGWLGSIPSDDDWDELSEQVFVTCYDEYACSIQFLNRLENFEEWSQYCDPHSGFTTVAICTTQSASTPVFKQIWVPIGFACFWAY